ncbi:transcription factor HRS1-like isoform X2 [Euphorbia lathyris]|uniref:transcription factor HRS1-like isoform X2 n=1 Tax=Euphorbia lathyris TaxID=212925 RepID=UPI003313B7F4
MGSLPPELSLDFRQTYLPRTITDFIKDLSIVDDIPEKVSKLDGFVKGLEEEMKKIDAFKRELPLCMLLLNDAIQCLKAESMKCAASNIQPVLEEFIPLKINCRDDDDEDQTDVHSKKEKDSRDKKNWMSSVQLWNTNDHPSSTTDCIFDPKQNLKKESKIAKKDNQCVNEDTFQVCKSRSAARAFMPFKTYPGFSKKEDNKINISNIEDLPVPGLSLLTPGIKSLREDSSSSISGTSCSRTVSSSAPNPQPSSNLRNGSQQQTTRKQRRCWSPELHRRFVNALQQLGGSQSATPKQIRELMQVDGLTNDEVKSHLQKYRLHTRRMPAATAAAAAAANHSIVLGGLWMSHDQYNDSKATSSQSGSPQGPLQLAGQTGGDSMEDEDDAKSEDYSWKSHIHRSGKDDV